MNSFPNQQAVAVSGVEPKTGVLGGGTLVRVLGRGFAPSATALVRVGSQPAVVARVVGQFEVYVSHFLLGRPGASRDGVLASRDVAGGQAHRLTGGGLVDLM